MADKTRAALPQNRETLPFGRLLCRRLSPLLLLLATSAGAQEDFSKVEIKTSELAPGIYMLEGAGGNLGLSVGEDGAFLIDDQYAPMSAKIQAAVAKVSQKPIRFVVSTHWHFDHTGGNENMGQAGAVLVAHDNVRTRMKAGQLIKFFNFEVPPAPHIALPVVTFADSVTFHVNGDELAVLHIPRAHTDGDSVVHFKKANVIHMGDLYFAGMYPFIDLESGGAVDGVIAAGKQILAMADDQTKIIPGHGPVSSKADLAEYVKMLETIRANVAALVAAGKSQEEAIAAKPTAALDEKWGKGFIKSDTFASLVYQSLKNKS